MNRNLAERERRSTMRNLLSRLFSLLPPQPTRTSTPDALEQARLHINQFQRHVEELRRRRGQLRDQQANQATNETIMISPVLNITEFNYNIMEVNLIAGLNVTFTLSDMIQVIQEEGAEVLKVTYNAGNVNKVLSILCQPVYPRIGVDSSRLLQRLRNMIEE